MNVNRRCRSEGSLLEVGSDEEFIDAQTVKQRIFDELKRIIVPHLNLVQNNSFRCPFCCPKSHENDSILYRCPICLQKAAKTKKQSEIVPYVAKSRPSFSLTDLKSEQVINTALAIEDVKKSAYNLEDISNTLKQLYKARDLLDPVINEIILSASQLTVREIKEFRKDNYPICYITAKQFKDTSDVINMFLKVVKRLSGQRPSLPTNRTSKSLSYFNEVIVNTLYLVNKDDPYGSPEEQKVYVDKFVLKELIQLHEVLGCTIAVIQDAEKKERHKPKDILPKESDSVEITRKLSAASRASLSHKQKVQKREGRSKKYRSNKPCATGASKDRECRGVTVKAVKKPSRTMAEMAKYKECAKGERKTCKPSDGDKECQRKGGLFACCNKKKCKKETTKTTPDDKKKSISFAESKNNVLLDFKVDGRPIQIRMDKNTKEYLVRSLQKSQPLNITANDEKSPNAQESSNFINSVMLDRRNHDYCKKGSPYTADCGCESDDSKSIARTSPILNCAGSKFDCANDNTSRNFETSSMRKNENTYTQTRNSKTSTGGLCRTKNAFGPTPFVCLNFAGDTQTLNSVNAHASQSNDSDSDLFSSKCTSGVTKLYPKSDEESTGIQTFLATGTNNYFWDSHKHLSDPDGKLLNQSVSIFSLPKCNHQPKNALDIKSTKHVFCQKEDQQLKCKFSNDNYRKGRKTSQSTETRCVEYTTLRCVAEKETELIQSESCSYCASEDCSYDSLGRKYTIINNEIVPCYRSCQGLSDTSFKVYTALNTQGMIEQISVNQRGTLNICCKCKRRLQDEEEKKSQIAKNDEDENGSIAIQTSQEALKESAVRSSQTEDKENPQPIQDGASLQQLSNSVQTGIDLKGICKKIPRSCKDANQGTSNGGCRGCLRGQSRSRVSICTIKQPPDNFQEKTTASTQEPSSKVPSEDSKYIQNDLNVDENGFVSNGNKNCRSRAAQSSNQNISIPGESYDDLKNVQNNLEEKRKYITCEKKICRVGGVQTDGRILCPEEAKETQTLLDQYNSEAEKESSIICSAVQTNDEEQSPLHRNQAGSFKESENRNNNAEKTDRLCCRRFSLGTSAPCESNSKLDNTGMQTENQNSDNEQLETQEESKSNKDIDVTSLQIKAGSGTGKKDLMVIKIVVPEAAAAAIEQSLRDEATATPDSNNNLPVAVEIVSSYSTNVKVLKSDADVCTNSKRPSTKSDRSDDRASLSRHITPVKSLLPPRYMSANRVKVSKAIASRPGIRVNSDSICRCNQVPQNRKKSSFQGELNECECKSCSCPSLVKCDDEKENANDRRTSSCKNVGTWRQTVLEAIYRLLFGDNCENFKKGKECEIDVEDTTATVKFSQESQCPSVHGFRSRDKKESLTYRCNLVSPNFGDLSVMRKAIDKDLISQLGDILKVKSSKLCRKGDKLDLSLVLSFQTQTTTKFKTKENISCITEPENGLNIGNIAWGITANFKSEKNSVKNNKFSRQVTSTSFLKNILRKHSCHSILINPLVENSLKSTQNSSISTRELN